LTRDSANPSPASRSSDVPEIREAGEYRGTELNRLALRRSLPLAAAAVALFGGGVDATTARGAHSPYEHSGPGLVSRIVWKRWGVRLQCARVRVRVPLDWAHRGGPEISLPVIRHLASRPTRRIGSLFVNGGGAMGSVDLVRTDGARLDALGRARFKVVGWALRGTAGATPVVRCFADQQSRATFWNEVSIPTTRAQELAYNPKTIAYTRSCGTLSGRLLAQVFTTDDARDLDYLRRLVDDRQQVP
jgi:hypothetical protein